MAVLSTVLAASFLVAVTALVSLAHRGSCEIETHPSLSVDELIDVRQRFEAYRAAPETGFSLAAAELAMLIEDPEAPALFVDLEGTGVTGSVAWPDGFGRCLPVRFDGTVVVEDATVHFEPAHLTVGALDLGWWYRGRTLVFTPEDLPSDRVGHFLSQTRRATVEDGRLEVALRTPASFRFR